MVTVRPKVAAQASKCSTPAARQQVGLEVVLHDPHLGDAVGHEGGGGEDGGAAPVGVAQVLEFEVEVRGPLGLAAGDAVDAGGEGQVFEQVGLVDEELVDAGVLRS